MNFFPDPKSTTAEKPPTTREALRKYVAGQLVWYGGWPIFNRAMVGHELTVFITEKKNHEEIHINLRKEFPDGKRERKRSYRKQAGAWGTSWENQAAFDLLEAIEPYLC